MQKLLGPSKNAIFVMKEGKFYKLEKPENNALKIR